MSWWTQVQSLTPIAVWDAAGKTAGALLDKVNSNHATGVSNTLSFSEYLAVKGNGNLWPLGSPVTLPAESTIAGLVKVQSNSILFYGGNSVYAYMFDQESSGSGYYFYGGPGTPYQLTAAGPAFDTWKFVAVVKRVANFGFYINGNWITEFGGNLISLPPSIGGFGYSGNGSTYNYNENDRMSAAGVWSGAATLVELQALEAAVRLAMVPPPVSSFSALVKHGYLVTNSLALQPGAYPCVDQALKAGRKNIYQGGAGTIQGSVTIENIPGARQVRLFDKRSGLVVAETWSSPTGHYEFNNVAADREYFVVAHDHLRVYNAVVQDMLTP